MVSTRTAAVWTVPLLALLGGVRGHIALWDEGMYGYDPADGNQQEPVTPLRDLAFSSWWFHGYMNRPPAPGKIMQLPSGGTYHGQVACNKALTTLGVSPKAQEGIYACDGDDPVRGGIGAMHTADRWTAPLGELEDVTGCALAIAYESDPTRIQPEDFVVISTNWTCPWFKKVDFEIPADLPKCPEGGCHCLWGWVPSGHAGRQENYVLNYRCEVTGANGVRALPKPNVSRKCDFPNDTSNCTVGAKQPHYWLQLERNNVVQDIYDAPVYNGKYGYRNGAQLDLWAGVDGSTSPAPAPASAPSSGPGSVGAYQGTGGDGGASRETVSGQGSEGEWQRRPDTSPAPASAPAAPVRTCKRRKRAMRAKRDMGHGPQVWTRGKGN